MGRSIRVGALTIGTAGALVGLAVGRDAILARVVDPGPPRVTLGLLVRDGAFDVAAWTSARAQDGGHLIEAAVTVRCAGAARRWSRPLALVPHATPGWVVDASTLRSELVPGLCTVGFEARDRGPLGRWGRAERTVLVYGDGTLLDGAEASGDRDAPTIDGFATLTDVHRKGARGVVVRDAVTGVASLQVELECGSWRGSPKAVTFAERRTELTLHAALPDFASWLRQSPVGPCVATLIARDAMGNSSRSSLELMRFTNGTRPLSVVRQDTLPPVLTGVDSGDLRADLGVLDPKEPVATAGIAEVAFRLTCDDGTVEEHREAVTEWTTRRSLREFWPATLGGGATCWLFVQARDHADHQRSWTEAVVVDAHGRARLRDGLYDDGRDPVLVALHDRASHAWRHGDPSGLAWEDESPGLVLAAAARWCGERGPSQPDHVPIHQGPTRERRVEAGSNALPHFVPGPCTTVIYAFDASGRWAVHTAETWTDADGTTIPASEMQR